MDASIWLMEYWNSSSNDIVKILQKIYDTFKEYICERESSIPLRESKGWFALKKNGIITTDALAVIDSLGEAECVDG